MQTYARISLRPFPPLSPTTAGLSTVVVLPLKIVRSWVSRKFFSFEVIYVRSTLFLHSQFRTAGQQDVDGFLVGGASLKPEFADIINARKE
jgi:Triosephosphate isomerase